MTNIFSFICKRNDYGYLTFFNSFSFSNFDLQIRKTDIAEFLPWIVIPVLFRLFIGTHNLVPTMSMMPTIDIGDIVYVNKLAYLFDSPQRGDIITFDKPTYLVKRVVGIPGDKLSVKDGLVYINGEQLPVVKTRSQKLERGGFESLTSRAFTIPVTETALNGKQYQIFYSHRAKGEQGTEAHKINLAHIMYLANFDEITIPDGKYFAMGDNRMFSSDSRKFGLVDESEIVGRVSTVILNLNAFKAIFKAIFTDEPTDNLFLFKNIAAS